MKDVPILKYTSYGNNFVIVDETQEPILTEAEKSEFASLLNSPTEASLVLNVEVENSSVLLLTYPELEKMVQEFKGV